MTDDSQARPGPRPRTLQRKLSLAVTLAAAACVALIIAGSIRAEGGRAGRAADPADSNAGRMLDEGRQTFRFDSFGSEAFWGDTLGLHRAIAGERFGGVGPGVSPRTALAVGLKVDVDALPKAVQKQIRKGKVDLDDPAVTLELL